MPSYLYPQPTSSGGGGNSFIIIFVICLGFVLMPYFFAKPQPDAQQQPQALQQAADTQQPSAAPQIRVSIPTETRTLETDDYRLVMTNAGGGRPSGFFIKNPDRYQEHGETGDYIRSQKPASPDTGGMLPFEMKLPSFQITPETTFQITSAPDSDNAISFHYQTPDNTHAIDKVFSKTSTPFVIHADVKLTNNTPNPISDTLETSMFILQNEDEEPGLFKPGSYVAAKCHADGKMKYVDATDKDEKESYEKNVTWAGVDESYFAVVINNNNPDIQRECVVANKDGVLKSTLRLPVVVQPNSQTSLSFDIYMGPKEDEYLGLKVPGRDPEVSPELARFGAELPSVIDYGWIEVLAKPMAWILATFQRWVGNWGLAIIILTLIVRGALWPLAHKSQMSMMSMTKLTPLMKELQEKYKDDQQALAQEQMKLYQKYGVNPAAGCLPLLIQMPVFFALYRCIYVTGGLYHAPFCLWIHDLSAPDPYFILPILTVILFVSQQLFSTSKAQNMQQKVMMYSMPIFFGVMMLFLPSGLCLYMVVSTLISIVQSFYVRRVMANVKLPGLGDEPTADAKNATVDV